MKKQAILALAAAAFAVSGGVASAAGWKFETQSDEMSDALIGLATSPLAYPKRKLAAPYEDLQAFLGYKCGTEGGGSQTFRLHFNSGPVLSGGTQSVSIVGTLVTKYVMRVRWDDTLVNEKINHWGDDSSLTFSWDAIDNVSTHSRMKIEIPWYKEGSIYFEFDLTGAREAITQAKNVCGR